MIQDISPLDRSSWIFRFLSKGRCGGAPLTIQRLIEAYGCYAIEMKFGRMMLDISPHNRLESDFPVSPRGRCLGAPSEIFKSMQSSSD